MCHFLVIRKNSPKGAQQPRRLAIQGLQVRRTAAASPRMGQGTDAKWRRRCRLVGEEVDAVGGEEERGPVRVARVGLAVGGRAAAAGECRVHSRRRVARLAGTGRDAVAEGAGWLAGLLCRAG